MIEAKRTQWETSTGAFNREYQELEPTERARAPVVLLKHSTDGKFVHELFGGAIQALNLARRADEFQVSRAASTF